jgi:hypothetical protein
MFDVGEMKLLTEISTSPVMSRRNSFLKGGDQEMLVPIAVGNHFFPFRTEPLSPPALMVLELMLRESKSVPTQYND